MVEFINKLTGIVMQVPDNRAEVFKAAGHTPAAAPPADKKPAQKKTPAKKQIKRS